MHPLIRILSLVIVAGALARADWPRLGVLAALIGAGFVAVEFRAWSTLLRTVLRMKFFLLSIAVLYLWFTPGAPLLPAWGAASPSVEGASAGLLRALALVVLVAAVQLTMLSTARAQLVGALCALMRPLRLLRIEPERVALRLVLAMEAVPELRAQLAPAPAAADEPRLRRWARTAGDAFARTLELAERAPLPVVELPELARPSWRQWLIPLALLVLVVLL